MTDDLSRRLSGHLDLSMRFLRTDSSWFEAYWLSEPRQAGIAKCNGVTRAVLLLCSAWMLGSTNYASAQCTARDVLQRQLSFGAAPAARTPKNVVTSASDVAVWKTIEVGTFSDSSALFGAMRAMGCGVGDAAAAALAQPDFSVSATRASVELVTLSAAELGFPGETASLRQIYAFVQRLGFRLAPAEIALQLRLQYLDQPVGEFLNIGMAPIQTPAGEPVILTVANGGAGLILIGQDGRADVEIPVTARFAFVQSRDASPEQFPGPWLEVTQEIRDILALKKISACSQAAARVSSINPDEYLLYCTSDGNLWTSWLIQPAARTVRGPGRLFKGIALPDGY